MPHNQSGTPPTILTNAFPEVPIWPGSSSFESGDTAFGFYDEESDFQIEAVAFGNWAAKRLGYPVVNVELEKEHFYNGLEEGVNEYMSQVNQYNIRENLLLAQGTPTSSNLTQNNITNTLGRIIQLATAYGAAAGVGGNTQWKRGYVQTAIDQQVYDLNTLWADVSESGNRIQVERVFHEGIPAQTRFYDPFVETGLSKLNVLDDFGFLGFSSAVQYVLFPIYEDLLRIQSIEFNDLIRRSAFTFEITDNKLRIFPIPQTVGKFYFDYTVVKDNTLIPASDSGSLQENVQSDFSNIQYNIIPYNNINGTGRQWIRRYGMTVIKQVLGNIRSKYASIPFPNGEVSLDGDTLRSEGIAESEFLVEQLRKTLEESSRSAQLERRQIEEESIQATLRGVPLKIYIG
jgi:hypothetical protein